MTPDCHVCRDEKLKQEIERLLEAHKAVLDAKIASEKEVLGEVALETAIAWWAVATALRDTHGVQITEREHDE